MTTRDEVPALARPFAATVIALMLASALFLWEPWPFTTFRLFSHLRSEEQVSWVAEATTPSGGTVDYAIPGLIFTVPDFLAAEEGRNETCRNWIEGAPPVIGEEASEVSVIEERTVLSDRDGDRAAPPTRTVVIRCDESGGTVVG